MASRVIPRVAGIVGAAFSQIGALVMPVIEGIIGKAPSIGKAFLGAFREIGKTVVSLAQSFIRVLLPAILVIGDSLSPIFQDLMVVAGGALRLIGNLLGAIVKHAPVVIEGLMKVARVVAGIVLPAIIIVLVRLADLIGFIYNIAKSVITIIAGVIKTVIETLVNWIVQAANAVGGVIMQVAQIVGDALGPVSNVLKTIGRSLIDMASPFAETAARDAGDLVKNILKDFGDWMTEPLRRVEKKSKTISELLGFETRSNNGVEVKILGDSAMTYSSATQSFERSVEKFEQIMNRMALMFETITPDETNLMDWRLAVQVR